MIRKIEENEKNDVISLIWESYQAKEAQNDTKEGQETFRRIFLDEKSLFKEQELFGFYENEILLGVSSLDDSGYIQYLFVERNHLSLGIGKMLLCYILDIAKKRGKRRVTLDSSAYAYPFYLHMGFSKAMELQIENGMSYIPMEYNIKL